MGQWEKGSGIMKCRVKIYTENKDLISDDIWYGSTLEDVRFWVELSIKEIMSKTQMQGLNYQIDEI